MRRAVFSAARRQDLVLGDDSRCTHRLISRDQWRWTGGFGVVSVVGQVVTVSAATVTKVPMGRSR